MKRKKVWAGLAAAVAGVGLVQYLRSQGHDNGAEGWTPAAMPDMTGRVVVITGGNSGIGFEAAQEFAGKGAQVVLACRSLTKAKAALADIKAAVPEAQVAVMALDLASLASVRQFAESFNAKYDRLDILVNNAGIMMVPYGTTEDGFEKQLGVNHLGHFALTGLLLERLKGTPGARVVNISSNAHKMGSIDFANLQFADGTDYTPIRAYGRSKLANILFTNELQRRFAANGLDVMAVAAHPGGSNTNLANHITEGFTGKVLMPFFSYLMQSAAMGALSTLRAAVDPAAQGGDYYGPDGFMETRGHPIKAQTSEAARSESDQQKLWEVSEELTGVSYL